MTIVRTSPEAAVDSSFTVYQLFCRLMLQVSLIAIPAYLAIFMLAIPFDMDAGMKRGLILLTPVLEFFVAAVLYSLSFLTTLSSPDRESFDGSSRFRSRVMRRKMLLTLLGSISLSLGILSGSLMLVKAHL
ncbi:MULTISPECIES: hypothetical protein [Cyanophyceae]|uniref:hypothetical protein n=1 Tax=Cyanophyceae TaxID=3028117 RepID=UPI0016823358|nr:MULTISPECIES: hypothetical protein [Cyanophyceae]MBD1914652.1 hypothetical protein [Phormidium sp. FACHB-77]MBD2032540.1 hypothetical protein [Phormidium sp. FACHB-322]MBD2049398.1 hypothetical protein [Leptolyngbya sp. FACHB-60]